MLFRVIRYKFEEFSDHGFCYLEFCGWLKGEIYVERRNRLREAVWDHSQSI